MSQYIVGVSGGIGSGKTTVTNLFAEQGIHVVDADIVARQVVAPGTDALHQIASKFGSEILNADQTLNRAQLRQVIFQQAELKSWLNDLLHPIIRQTMWQQTLLAKSAYCLLSAPLLVENELHLSVNRVLIIDVDESLQLSRTILRDNSNAQQIRAIMAAQVSREKRLSVADDVIDNNHDIAELVPQVARLHQQYLQVAENIA
ncbi:dephospho-CoA kinase [Paraglaciecola aquimarina]|uniref:Dephospho-CoA kinase n=1 Tax=Paraglaciecola aquimarina TaxID=1235557 RepID=A0ABU3SWC5_9ALTE|nr:dephospho-CoA kinase [Paraglaciecola aquimarina]MDU0354304.1 dephospho-CoA kinase [Paraglaciecola aquimarina]